MAEPDLQARFVDAPECPDLRGNYALAVDARTAKLQREIAEREGVNPVPLLPSTLRIEQETNGQVSVVERLHPDSVDAAALRLRADSPQAYRTWWRLARQGVGLQGDLRSNLKLHFDALAEHGPAQERTWLQLRPHCEAGWMQVGQAFAAKVDLEGSSAAGGDEVWLTRDREGGLLMRVVVELDRREITIWCGDGCKGIPYHVSTTQRWMRFPPAEPEALWTLNVQRLPALAAPETPGSEPPEIAFATIEPASPTVAAPAPPPTAVIEALPVVPDAPQAAEDERVAQLEVRLRSWLSNVDEVHRFEATQGQVQFEGSRRSNREVSELLRWLHEDVDVENAELVQVQASPEGRMRFSILIRLKALPGN
ncbi:hypothetical protein [Aquimonas sp.]|jgi:hypothetical protein|uniref:hypothetical protein n=1 Tax=Aquimonas sp. TaxID=1872588 RepID=UPI0037BF4B5B